MDYAIDEKSVVTLGGYEQHIRIRAVSTDKPILLFLHGGPGVCDRHWVLNYQSSLAAHAIMVCWDQRGAGLSWSKNCGKMTVSRMVDDAAELASLMCKRFDKKKVIIVGHSWGSLLGTLLAHRYPDLIECYIGMGQYVYGADNERISYEFVLEQANERGDKKALADLERIGAPKEGHYASIDDLMVQRNLMTKYGGGEYNKHDGIMKSMIIPILKSPEYSLFDMWKYYKGAFSSLEKLWCEVVDANLFEEVKELKMPVYLTEGRHDLNTPIEISLKWFEQLKAPKKQWIWFEESAHSPIKEEPEKWGLTVAAIVDSFK